MASWPNGCGVAWRGKQDTWVPFLAWMGDHDLIPFGRVGYNSLGPSVLSKVIEVPTQGGQGAHPSCPLSLAPGKAA